MAFRASCAALFGLALLTLLVACGGGSSAPATPAAGLAAASGAGTAVAPGAPAPRAAASAPPVSVSVVRAQRRDVSVQIEANGTVSALASVDIKPQVASVVTAVHVKEGQFVAKDQPLFTLDSRADAANLARAEAQLLKDQATLADAQRQLVRSKELLEKNFISQGAVDTAQAQVEAQRAAVASDRAAIEAARVAVSYGRIVAPSAGRVGQINVFVGSSVSPSGAPMVSITQLDPIAVSFNLPQRNLPDALQALAAAHGSPPSRGVAAPASTGKGEKGDRGVARGERAAAAGAAASAPAITQAGMVLAQLPEGRGTRVGRLDFVDNLVDAASGTVRVKAVFTNRDQALWPGAYVNVQLALQVLPGAVVVPQAAIVQGARGTAVFVVDADGLAAVRPVRVVQALGVEAVVSGVRPGEKIVMDGRQNVRPGSRLVEREPDRPGGGSGGGRRGAAASGPAGGASGAGSGPPGTGGRGLGNPAPTP